MIWTAAALLAVLVGASAGAESPSTTAADEPEATGQLIEGIVLNHYGGGIAGARVRIESLDAGADDPPLAEGVTSSAGEIAIRLPAPVDAKVRVRIRLDGYADWVQVVDPANEDDPPFIDATLEGAGKLTGTVRAKDANKPVAGALVRCDNAGRNLQAQTDAKGRYALDGVLRGPAVLTVFADGFAIERTATQIESDEARVDIELRRERPIELTVVTNEGDPAGQVLIEATVEPTQNYLSAMTDAGGKAMLRGVGAEAETIRLRLNGDRYVRTTEFAETIAIPSSQPADTQPAAAGPTPIRQRLVITIAGRIRGKVVDAESGEPIVGVRVIAGRELRADMPMIWTSLEGTYELAGLSPGLNLISFQHGDYATTIREAHLNTGQSADLDVRLEAGLPIAGKVVDDAGKPLEQVWISAEDWKGYATLGLRTFTGEDGTFSFTHAPPGDIAFSFLKRGCGPPRREVLAVGKTDHRIVLEAPVAGPSAGPGLEAKIAVGKALPELALTATDGTCYRLSELRGKYVFLDFWASWCGPCVMEIRNVKALREATQKRDDFLLIGVSLDDDRKAFERAVKEHDMNWPQVFGPKSGAVEAFQTLDGFGIPYTCLIGPDGKMLAQHLRGPTIADEVKKHLPK